MKTQDIKSLQIIYNIQAVIGLLFTIFGTLLVSIMSTDAPNHSEGSVFISGLFSFILSFTITIGLPMAAHRELENFHIKRKLIFNSIDTLLMFFIFFPIAILQLLLLSKVHKNDLDENNNESSIIDHEELKESHKIEDFDKYAEQRLEEIDESLKQYNKTLRL